MQVSPPVWRMSQFIFCSYFIKSLSKPVLYSEYNHKYAAERGF
ncbi:hypothetical protein BAXH7_00556 [Bacillus amyloliquefaciens XH7]|nr:hypothetical protein LL3_00545 [Bacillus amyloliquefaciens LL3]AEK87702.1 hypothetical protein BAXH7_00556 [Bacillus amyloliquefaciens XH7]KYC93168.1 hypothetical protein B425_0539 [Bacillus amyloliquefaciens]